MTINVDKYFKPYNDLEKNGKLADVSLKGRACDRVRLYRSVIQQNEEIEKLQKFVRYIKSQLVTIQVKERDTKQFRRLEQLIQELQNFDAKEE